MIISHRGNLRGPRITQENNPSYLEAAHAAVGNVEADVWWQNGDFWLGHDAPQFSISISWLKQPWLWCHAKNIEALSRLLAAETHCFWHENDLVTLTSKGIPWCRPGTYLPNGISVVIGSTLPQFDALGYCTDYAADHFVYG